MRHTTSRTKSRSFTLIERVPLPQLTNLTARKEGGRTPALEMRKAGGTPDAAGQLSIIAVL